MKLGSVGNTMGVSGRRRGGEGRRMRREEEAAKGGMNHKYMARRNSQFLGCTTVEVARVD